LSLLTAAGAIVIGLVLALLIGRGISRPIIALTSAMRQLASGTLEVAIPNAARRDELGEMARAVAVFKDNALAMRRLKTEQALERQRGEPEKRTAFTQMAETIETVTGNALELIRQRTTAMTETADAMSASADRTGIAAETGDTGRRAAGARENATFLTATIEDWRDSVSQALRTSTTEIDRRDGHRLKVSLPSGPGEEVFDLEQENRREQLAVLDATLRKLAAANPSSG